MVLVSQQLLIILKTQQLKAGLEMNVKFIKIKKQAVLFGMALVNAHLHVVAGGVVALSIRLAGKTLVNSIILLAEAMLTRI
jgi:hypothetical protein